MPAEKPSQGITLQDADNGKSLSIKSLKARAVVDGPVGTLVLTATFNNDLGGDKPLEGDLVFPMPPFASLRALKTKVGAREIEGKFKPRDRAQADYDRAQQAGQTAALAESEGEDLGRLRISPIEKGEDVEVVLEILQPLTAQPDGHKMIIPTTYMPRFVEDESKLKPTEKAAVERPRPTTLAARADIEVVIRSISGKAPAVRCLSHPAQVSPEQDGTLVRVSNEPLDRDCVIEILDKCEGQDPIVWSRHDPSDGADAGGPTTAVALVPPKFAEEGKTTPRDIIFLVDRSGSMNGAPMEAAQRAVKGCLRALGPGDRFNVISFDDKIESLAPTCVEFGEGTLQAADQFVDALHARGGTRASMAIEAALSGSAKDFGSVAIEKGAAPDPNLRLRILVMLTDGDVASSEEVVKKAREKMHDTRMFTIGIGDSVDHAVLASLAESGRGAYIPSGTDPEGIEDVVSKLKTSLDAPLITGVKLRIEEDGAVRDAPRPESAGVIDLFAGQSLLLAFRGALKPGAVLIVSGQRSNGEDFRMRAPLKPEGDGSVAATIWGMLRNKSLTYRFDPNDDAALEELGVAFGLVNRRTALVGVHAEQRGLQAPETVPVVLPMPRNLAQAQGEAGHGGFRSFGGTGLLGAAPVACAAGPAAGMSFRGGAPKGLTRSAGALLSAGPAPTPQWGNTRSAPDMDEALESMDLSRGIDPFPTSRFADTAAGLRSLLLELGGDGLFGGSLAATLAAVAALAKRGHTMRSGNFRAELRRTAAKVGSMPATGLSLVEVDMVELILAILRQEKGADALSGSYLVAQALLQDPLAKEIYEGLLQ